MILPITVIIPTMNRPESLDRTLKYMMESDDIPQQVIVVDQSQNKDICDKNRSVLEKCTQSQSNLYVYQEIPSLTKARNTGIELAENEIIVFSDDDVDVHVDTFSSLISLFEDSTIAMIGGICEGDDRKPSLMSYIWGMASYRKRKKGHISRACYGRFPYVVGNQTPTEWAMGFFFAVRKSLIDKWRIRFDEKLLSYAYAEDLDFSYGYYLCAKKESFRCIMSRLVTVKHNVSKEYRVPQRSHIFMTVLHRYYISKKYELNLFELYNLWCNLGILVFKILKQERPLDILEAQIFYYKHRKDILKGNFLNEYWKK